MKQPAEKEVEIKNENNNINYNNITKEEDKKVENTENKKEKKITL